MPKLPERFNVSVADLKALLVDCAKKAGATNDRAIAVAQQAMEEVNGTDSMLNSSWKLECCLSESSVKLPQVQRRVLDRSDAQSLAGGQPPVFEVSTQEAADFLGVSRPFVVKLIDNGQLKGRKVGRHRRVELEDVKQYRVTMYKDATKTWKELVKLESQGS